MCVLVSTDRTVNTIVHTAVGRVAFANLPHKDLFGKGKGRGVRKRPEWFRGGGRPKHHCQAPHTGDERSLISDTTGEIAGYDGAKRPCVGSA